MISLTHGCIVYTAGCQTGCTTRFDNRLNEQWLFVQHSCQTGLTTGWMFVYTIQPVVKPVVNRLSNRSNNWLYRVYKHSTGCQTRLTTGLTKRLYRIEPVVKPVVQPGLTTG